MREVNLFISLLALWIIMVLYDQFWRAKIDKARFRLFALRDRLAILAMKGEVDFKSEEYDLMMRLLNRSIKTLGTFRVVDFVRSTIALYGDEELKSKIMKMDVSLRKHDHKEFRGIADEYFKVAYATYKMFLFLPTKVFLPLLWPLWFILRQISSNVNTITLDAKTLHEVDSYLKSRRAMMST